jgi:hypothetical protein
MRALPMRLVVLAGLLVATVPAGTAYAATSAQRQWSSATLMPGVGGDWSVPFAVSCTGPGDCAAGGEYGPEEPYTQSLPFVVTETGGQWASAQELTGIPALGGNQYAAITSVSCGWPGNCAAVGYYRPDAAAGFTGQAFVANQVDGTWQSAQPLAGVTASLDSSALGGDWVITVSCAPAKTSAARAAGLDCLAGGSAKSSGHYQGFVVQATDGRWGGARLVPGLARLGGTRLSQVNAVSCPAAGACAIGGYYTDGNGHRQAFVADETGGSWHSALEVPCTSALNVKGRAEVDAVDCPVAGDCTAAGDYLSGSGAAEFFVVNAAGGRWRGAIQLPGLAGHGTGTSTVTVSCTSAGGCEVGGTLDTNSAGGTRGFLIGQARGRWGTPHLLPGTSSAVTTLSCPVAGGCTAGGTTSSLEAGTSGIVLDQVDGTWGAPVTVAPGNGITGAVTDVSCFVVGDCVAVGYLPVGWSGGPSAAVAAEG